jgi:DNA recombination protein RmuC
MNTVYFIVVPGFFILTLFALLLFRSKQKQCELKAMLARINEQNDFSSMLQEKINALLVEQQRQSSAQQLHGLKVITESLQHSMGEVRSQMTLALGANANELNNRVVQLTETTDKKLREITDQVGLRLSEGFEKTATTFTDVIKRLALVDEAQKKIAELSNNVLNLQEILTDKRARGAFGEMQLATLLCNVLPKQNVLLQHTLSNGRRVDCLLRLPEPTGSIAIDAKFPLESYQKFVNPHLDDHTRKAAQQQFRLDVRRHIQDIAERYIIPGETADGAMMFIPAEAIFAEIHGHYPDLIELSYNLRVWLVSPATLMAILTTAQAVIRDSTTRGQVHIIREHLLALSKDFERFQNRMDNLAKHFVQVNGDIDEVQRSAKKISHRFFNIEKVEESD